MIDASFIRQHYKNLADGQLEEMAIKEGRSLTREAFAVLTEEFVRRGLDAALIEKAGEQREMQREANMLLVREGKGAGITKVLLHYALYEIKKGKTYQEIYEGLMEKGADEQLALTIAEGLEIEAYNLLRKQKYLLWGGALLFLAGVGFTILTLNSLVVFYFYGAIATGLAAFSSGLVGISSYKKILKNCIKQRQMMEPVEAPMPEAALLKTPLPETPLNEY